MYVSFCVWNIDFIVIRQIKLRFLYFIIDQWARIKKVLIVSES